MNYYLICIRLVQKKEGGEGWKAKFNILTFILNITQSQPIQGFKQQITFILPLWEDDSGSGIDYWLSHKIVSHVFVSNRNPNS